jgi:chromosomal replication initiator protein
MEGCLNKIVAFSALTGQSVTKQLVSEVMRDMKSVRDSRRITSEFIIQTVCDYFDVSALDIKSQKRTREIAVPRQIAMYLIRDMLSLSLPAIGREFGGRDHTTVMHACDKIEKDLKNDRRLSENVQDLKKRISEG